MPSNDVSDAQLADETLTAARCQIDEALGWLGRAEAVLNRHAGAMTLIENNRRMRLVYAIRAARSAINNNL